MEPPKIIFHIPPIERMAQFNDWLHDFDSSFIKESFASFRDGMQSVLEYVEIHHPAALGHLNNGLVVLAEPLFNAFLDTTPKTYSGKLEGDSFRKLGEICVNIGIPITLACLKPALLFAARSMLEDTNDPIPTEVVVNVVHLYMAWHNDTYPPAFVTSLREDPALRATQTFIVAHEASHFLFHVDQPISRKYQAIGTSVFEQLVGDFEFFTASQMAQVKSTFRDPALYALWVEELAADLMAYDICQFTCDQKGRRDLFGVTTLCVLQAIFEHYLEMEEIESAPTHPYAVARLLAFEKHLQNRLGLQSVDFKATLDWQLPTRFFSSVCRILQEIRQVTWSSTSKGSRTYTAAFRRIRFKGEAYLLFGSGEIGTVETVKNLGFPVAHLFENGDIMQFGKRIGTIADIEFLGEGKMQVDVDKKQVKFL